MTWDFPTPLDHRNFFVVGQLLQGNVATITAYAPDNSVVNVALVFEQLRAQTSSFDFLEPLSWTAATGELKKSTTTGSNSGWGFFSIPNGTQVNKIVIALVDDGSRGTTADEVNYGIGCVLPDCTTDLIAGGGNPASAENVGEVSLFDNGDGTYDVTYHTTGDWYINEVHLQLACNSGDIPQTKNGNPIPGKFAYTDSGLSTQTYTFEDVEPLDGDGQPATCSADCLVVAAHAVVKDTSAVFCDLDTDEAIVYGIERFSGDVYAVNAIDGNSPIPELIFTISGVPLGSAKPNGLAYDSLNDRLYFCDYQPTTTLYFWDFGESVQKTAGSLGDTDVANAGFYNGKYYYIVGGNNAGGGTDDLYEVAFNADGTIAVGYPVKIADIASDVHGWTFNGDIAIKDGVIYGWGKCDIHGKYEFFTYDLYTNVFTVNETAFQAYSMQLAFGSDGTLYGHESRDNGNFYIVDTTNGNLIGLQMNPSGKLFTDCASGLRCYNAEETAWGAGPEFLGKNWATYFECGDECNVE
jgi:hypothetical protein